MAADTGSRYPLLVASRLVQFCPRSAGIAAGSLFCVALFRGLSPRTPPLDCRKQMARPRKLPSSPIPTWACRIRAVREKLRLNQLQFGRKLRCSSITISRWERGLQKPGADRLIAMGKMVGRSSGWYFWRMAGVRENDVRRMLQT